MKELNLEEKLMLLQGISLIEDGLQFLEYQECYLNECSYDVFAILKNRFECFKECTFDYTKSGHLVIDRARTKLDNVRYDYELKDKIKNELEDLRKLAVKNQIKDN